MPKIRDTATTIISSDLLDCEVILPTHVTDDLLLFIIAKDDATGGALTTPSGWTKGGENNNGASGANSVRAAWYYKVAVSGSETAPTVSSSDADTWSAVCVSIRGAHATPIDTSNGNGITDSTGNPYPAASVTTGFDNSLVLYAIGSDGGVSPVAAPGFTTAGIADSSADACALAWKIQRTAGAAGTCDFYASGTADESVLFTIAIRDGSSGAILPGYPNSDVATIVQPLKGANLTFTGDALDANSNNFSQLAGTWAAVSTAYQVDASPLTFTDVTTAANGATDADVIPFPATEATSDYFAIRYSSAFRAIRFDRAGCTAGAAGVCAREYLSSAGTWKALADFFDSTTSFTTAVGDHQICGWTVPADWNSQSLNGVSGFWVRFRITTIYTTNPTISQVFVSTSLALHHDTITGRTDAGVNPLFDAANVTPGFGGNLMSGGAYAMNSVLNLSTARLMGTFLFDSPRDFVDVGTRADGGIAIGLIDSANLLKAWVVGASDSKDVFKDKRNIFVVQVNQSVDTSLLSSTPTMSDIKRILLMANNRYGACTQSWNPLLNVGTLKVSGGGSTTPIDYAELIKVANAYPCPLIDEPTNTCFVPVQIGGSEAVNLQISGFFLGFPQQALSANKKTAFHVDENVVGLIIDIRSGDTCLLNNGTLTGLSPWIFNVLATADATATNSFSGLTLVGATVNLRVFDFESLTLTSCPSFTLHSTATIDGCSLSATKVSTTVPNAISNCAFTSGGTGHAIEATAVGTFTFDGNTFTGYGANATTDSAFYNNSGGLITLNLANYGDQIPTVRNGPGASTTIVPKPNVATVTGIVAGSRIYVYNNTAAAVVANEVVAGTTWTLNYQEADDFTVGDSITVRLTRQSGVTAYLGFTSGAVAGANGWSLLAAQVADSVYATLAIDGSTITDYAADYVNDEVDITVGADFYLSEMYAWWVYNLTTSQGISDFFGALTAIDETNFENDNTVVSIKLDNTTTTEVYALDNRRFSRVDAARPVRNPTSGGGGIDVEWRQKVFFINSAEITAIKAKTDSLTFSQSGQVDANVQKMNDADVIGTGTTGDRWRGVGVAP
jgi:hypothetical protein